MFGLKLVNICLKHSRERVRRHTPKVLTRGLTFGWKWNEKRAGFTQPAGYTFYLQDGFSGKAAGAVWVFFRVETSAAGGIGKRPIPSPGTRGGSYYTSLNPGAVWVFFRVETNAAGGIGKHPIPPPGTRCGSHYLSPTHWPGWSSQSHQFEKNLQNSLNARFSG
jgi:hypothetical protein